MKPIEITTHEITTNGLREELLPYIEHDWLHSLEYTVLKETILGCIPIHWHEEIQFVSVVKGIISLDVFGKKYSVEKGDGFFINSGILHSIDDITGNAEFICWNVRLSKFNEHIYKKYIIPLNDSTKVPYILLSQKDNIQIGIINKVGKALEHYIEQKNGYELVIESLYLLCINDLIQIINTKKDIEKKLFYDYRINEILEYIHKEYATKISLNQLANITHISKSETIKLFKKHLGITPFQYLLKFRLERSLIYLKNTESTVTEVSGQCGFSNVNYFISKFKEVYKVTPKKYQSKKLN